MDLANEPAAPPPARREPPQTRPGAVVLAAVLTEIVLIAAAGNQWVAERDGQWVLNEHNSFVRDLKLCLLVFNWRFAPQSGDNQHTWLSQVLLIVMTLVLTAVFAAVVVRGPATFGRVFLTCWLAIIGATVLATYVRALVNDQQVVAGSRIEKALFGPLSPSSLGVFAAVVLALVAGLVAAAVSGMVTKRVATDEPEVVAAPDEPPYVAPEQPPPFFPVRQAPPAEGQTTRFPRPPDDDDLDHLQRD